MHTNSTSFPKRQRLASCQDSVSRYRRQQLLRCPKTLIFPSECRHGRDVQDQNHSTPTDTAFGFAALPTLSRPPSPPGPNPKNRHRPGFRLSVAVLRLALVAGRFYGCPVETYRRRFWVLRGRGCGEGLHAGVVSCGKFCAGSRSR